MATNQYEVVQLTSSPGALSGPRGDFGVEPRWGCMRRSPSSTGEYRGSFEHRHGLLNMTTCRDLRMIPSAAPEKAAGFMADACIFLAKYG